MNRAWWIEQLELMQLGLSINEIARRLGRSYASTYHWVKKVGYPAMDARAERQFKERCFNWKLTDAQLAKRHHLSRQRVNFLRHKLTA